MKIDPLVIQVNDTDYTLGVIGFRTYLNATEEIRSRKERAFSRILSSIATDPLASPLSAASAIDSYMSGQIITDHEVRSWLFSPEGTIFLVGESLRRADKDVTDDQIDEFYDGLSAKKKAEIERFFAKCLLKDEYREPKEKNPDENPDGEA